jgi:hypothetical protein
VIQPLEDRHGEGVPALFEDAVQPVELDLAVSLAAIYRANHVLRLRAGQLLVSRRTASSSSAPKSTYEGFDHSGIVACLAALILRRISSPFAFHT